MTTGEWNGGGRGDPINFPVAEPRRNEGGVVG
jgi:hypothetical protein